MGGTKILGAAVTPKKILTIIKRPTVLRKKNNDYVKDLKKIIDELLSYPKLKKKDAKAICIGIPGSLNPYSGYIGFAPNLGIKNFNIGEKLSQHFSIPVFIENDVNLGAIGIRDYGAGKTAKNILVVFIGTGIGGALIFDKKLYRGSNFVAGEIGHIHVVDNGPLCGCGRRGCLEAIASRTAIERNIREDIKNGKESILTEIVKTESKIKSKMLANAVKNKDEVVTERISQACDVIGKSLASINNLLNFDMIVLGGGVIEAMHNFMIPKIKKVFVSYTLKDSSKGLKILPSQLGDDAALFGGISLAEEFLKNKIK
jgi:glucokinase